MIHLFVTLVQVSPRKKLNVVNCKHESVTPEQLMQTIETMWKRQTGGYAKALGIRELTPTETNQYLHEDFHPQL